MTLTEYLRATNQTQAGFATRASRGRTKGPDFISHTTVHRVCNGKIVSGRKAVLIVKATHVRPAPGGGVVSLEEILLPKRKRSKAA